MKKAILHKDVKTPGKMSNGAVPGVIIVVNYSAISCC